MATTKDFSWFLKVREADGSIRCLNLSNPARGYKQSWYKTPKAAQKALQYALDCEKRFHEGHEVIEAYCFTRSGDRF